MNEMRKIEIFPGRFVLYNDAFFVKSCNDNIEWTTSRFDAQVYPRFDAENCLEKINKFLSGKP